MEPFTKVIRPATRENYSIFCEIKFDGKRLSICGVEGPRRDGNCYGSCGQVVEHLTERTTLAPGWTTEMLERFRAIWRRWHLNDMCAGCEHQRDWPTDKRLEVVSYKLTTQALRVREEDREAAADAALAGKTFEPTATGRALAALTTWYESIFVLPAADSPLAGCYTLDKRESRPAGQVYPHEHPEGLLTKPCPTCGYKYGSAWLFEAVPEDVLQFLTDLPDSDLVPAWV